MKLSSLRSEERHPVVAGLIALASVAVALGLIAGLFAFIAAGVFGLGGGTQQAAQAAGDAGSLYLPTPSPTQSDSAPLITLSPAPLQDAPTETGDAATETPAGEPTQITLSAGETTVSPMDRIDLTGVYTGGEGAVLQVQRREGGRWTDFPVTTGVSGGEFSTYVQTGHTGAQKWRVIDSETKLASNVVTVTIQ